MFKGYRKTLLAIITASALSANTALADLNSDAELILDWAETTFPELFTSSETTQFAGEWRYRYYPELDLYAGINNAGEVAVLGEVFGGLQIVGTVETLLQQIPGGSTGGSTGNQNSGELNAGNGNCTPVVFPSAGAVVNFEVTTEGLASGVVTSNTMTVLSASNSVVSIRTDTSASGFGTETVSTADSTTNYTTENGYIYIVSTSATTNSTITAQGMSTSYSNTFNSEFATPHISSPATSWCEGQSWHTASVTVNTTTEDSIAGVSSSSTDTNPSTSTINSVNEVISVPAGTFTTIKMTEEETGGESPATSITWVDVNTGLMIKTESYDENNALMVTTQASSVQ